MFPHLSCSDNGGLNIEYIISDLIESGLFKKRIEASQFLKSVDVVDGNGSISCEEFRQGLSAESNLHRVIQFKRFIKKIRFGDPHALSSSGSSLPSMSRPSTLFRSHLVRRSSTF